MKTEASQQGPGVGLKTLAIVYLILAIFAIISRLSFVPDDIGYFSYPPQRPATNLGGALGAYLVYLQLFVFGEAFWIFPLGFIISSYRCLKVPENNWPGILLGHGLLYLVASLTISILVTGRPEWSTSFGGTFGKMFSTMMLQFLGVGGTWMVIAVVLTIGLYFLDPLPMFRSINLEKIEELKKVASEKKDAFFEERQKVDNAPEPLASETPVYEEPVIPDVRPQKKKEPESIKDDFIDEDQENSFDDMNTVEFAKAQKSKSKKSSIPKTNNENFSLPSMDHLKPKLAVSTDSDELMQQRAAQLEEMFDRFKIKCKVIGMEKGPSITQFEMTIDEGVRVNKVTALADNIALTLRAPSVRIVAPIPGRNSIGIEIPNIKKEMVNLRSIIEAPGFDAIRDKQILPLILGKDVAGVPLVSDLSKMPHLLVAGTTGSGKSVCINSIIVSLILYHKPESVRLLMIDPKMVEMSGYAGIPHLMRPVITDMNEAAGVLDWACRTMDERYHTLTKVRVRDIKSYNSLSKNKILDMLDDESEFEAMEWPMPYIVIIVDEFSDLMMVGAKEIEMYITRLAQKSRAVGIHVILATQRPSVDVITGLIKTNMPSRIAFQVAAKIDSRTILDQNGADKLMGKGDMLFLPPGTSALTRAQGVMIEDDEIESMVDYWKGQGAPVYIDESSVSRTAGEATKKSGGSSFDSGGGSSDEDSFDQAVQVVLESGRPSASYIQRQLKVGYNKASRLIEMMEERGVVGPPKGSRGREILMTLEEYKASETQDQ
jgi:S-DNA-T family DNA segregation ATPase FtsK/SpoIIIE